VWSQFPNYVTVSSGLDCCDQACVLQAVDSNETLKFMANEGEVYNIAVGTSEIYNVGDFTLALVVSLLMRLRV
jgi:hypothetical protein